MITAKLKTILTDSGCTLVIYEQDQLANIPINNSKPADIIGVIKQINDITLEIRANAIHEHYNPLTIEIMQQVRLEDAADNNEIKLQTLLNICKEIILRIINDAAFKTIRPVKAVKILERRYDANVTGWALPIDLYYLFNEIKDPCL